MKTFIIPNQDKFNKFVTVTIAGTKTTYDMKGNIRGEFICGLKHNEVIRGELYRV